MLADKAELSMNSKQYIVTGGVFTDTSFENVLVHTIERYGPFQTYDEALTVWSGKARAQIDICCHRLFIQEL